MDLEIEEKLAEMSSKIEDQRYEIINLQRTLSDLESRVKDIGRTMSCKVDQYRFESFERDVQYNYKRKH